MAPSGARQYSTDSQTTPADTWRENKTIIPASSVFKWWNPRFRSHPWSGQLDLTAQHFNGRVFIPKHFQKKTSFSVGAEAAGRNSLKHSACLLVRLTGRGRA